MIIRVVLNDRIIFIKLLLLIFSGTMKMKHFLYYFYLKRVFDPIFLITAFCMITVYRADLVISNLTW